MMMAWDGTQETKAKAMINPTKENNASSKKNRSDQKKQKKAAIWHKKVARYLAYCVNGGLLCSKFTMKTMIENLKTLDSSEQDEIHKEIAFLLHCHNRENPGQINELKETAKDIDPQNDSFNQNVMAVLIEDGYLRDLMR